MALEIGTRVGAFELTGTLGAGGMGEVYRARDSKLGRDVALKILPDHLIDADRLARFTREAQVVASLSHPNIAAIHGLEQLDGKPVLVLELVEGPTLADRIAQGPIPQDEAVAIARQIAEALEAAHEQGVVHRDLKPANVKLRPDGLVKVLDFGLAKLAGPPEGGPYDRNPAKAGLHDDRSVRLLDRRSFSEGGQADQNPTLSPTITSPAMTGIGLILGTAAYMSPEQAAGKPADKRADIWSFGVVLWEMLTGQRLFGDGESTSHVLADVLRAPIDFDKIPAGPLRELLRRCLDRNVRTRLRDIGEARVLLSRPIEPAVVVRDVLAPRRSTIVPWVVAGLLALAIGLEDWAPWRAEPERAPVRLDVSLGNNVALTPDTLGRTLVLSPDGTRLMYVASVGGAPNRLYIRRLEDLHDRIVEVPGSEGATAAAFSPDSRSIVFVVVTRVYRASVDGGAPLRLAEVPSVANQVTWGEGDIILVSGIRMGLLRIPANSGPPVPLTELAGNELIHAGQEVLPGGKSILFIAGGPTDVTTIEAIPAGGGMRKLILPNGIVPRYIPTGHLLYLLKNTLFAIRFNPETLATTGDPVPLVTDVKTTFSGLVAVGGFSVSENGTLVYRRTTGGEASVPAQQTSSTVEWIDTAGKRLPLVRAAASYFDPRLSPDGTRLLLTTLRGSGPDIVIHDNSDSAPRQLTFDALSVDPVWIGRDGRHFVFLKLGPGGLSQLPGGVLHWARTGGGDSQPMLSDVRIVDIGNFNPETNRLAFVVIEGAFNKPSTVRNIYTVTVTEENGQLKAGKPERFSPPQFLEIAPEISPDGRWIAFLSTRSGRDEIYVRALNAPAGGVRFERQVSTSGGRNPRWSRGKPELLYQSGDQIIAVPFVAKGDTWEPGTPAVRVEKFGGQGWDLAADGRIAVVTPVAPPGGKAPAPENTIAMVQNFFDEVRRKVK